MSTSIAVYILSLYAELLLAKQIAGEIAENKILNILEKIDPELDLAFAGMGIGANAERAAGDMARSQISSEMEHPQHIGKKMLFQMDKIAKSVARKVDESIEIDEKRSSHIYDWDNWLMENNAIKDIAHCCCKNLIAYKRDIFKIINTTITKDEIEWINEKRLQIMKNLMTYDDLEFYILQMCVTLQLQNILASIEYLIHQTCTAD